MGRLRRALLAAGIGFWAHLGASALAVAQPSPPPPQPGVPPPPVAPPAPGVPPAAGEPPPQAPSQQAPPQRAPPPAPGPSAGGLTAPDPIDPREQRSPTETEEQLDEAAEEDSGRGLKWFWLDAEGGFQHVGLETFEVDRSNLTAGLVPTEGSGGFVGAGLGARLLFLTVGPRFRVGFYDNWQLFSIGGEIGFRFPLSILEPHFELGGGYTALGSVGGALEGVQDAVSIHGGYGRISGGLDFFLGQYFSVGAGASWEFMGLTRPGVSPQDLDPDQTSSLEEAERQALELEGSGYGSAVSLYAKLGLHF